MAEAFTTYEYEITTARRIQSTRLIANKMAMAETEIKSEGSRKQQGQDANNFHWRRKTDELQKHQCPDLTSLHMMMNNTICRRVE